MAKQSEAEPERAAVVDDLIDALRTFSVETDVFVDVFARAHGLGRNDLNAIMWIAAGAQSGHLVTAGELAGRLGLGAPATTALVDRLETAGHVRRNRDARDRRRVTISMEEPALRLAYEFFLPLGQRMTAAVAGVSSADLAQTSTVIRTMIEAVTAARLAAAGSASPPSAHA